MKKYIKLLSLSLCVMVTSLLFVGCTKDKEVSKEINFFNYGENIDEKTKQMLDKMHKQKIDMSDEIYVINLDGYIGESTKNEIEYAKINGKKINYLECIR